MVVNKYYENDGRLSNAYQPITLILHNNQMF